MSRMLSTALATSPLNSQHKGSMLKPHKPWARLYKTARWQRMRERHLSDQPLCMFCLASEDVTPATVCDHIRPHKGNEDLFFDASNIQSLCKQCHDRDKQRIELGQEVVRFGSDGWPIE